jgi:ATP adenylyltransferase
VALEQLWAGWRHTYVAEATAADRRGGHDECIFCALAASGPPSQDNGVVFQGETAFAVLNLYPYASGHLLISPRRHVGDLGDLEEAEAEELWRVTRRAVAAIRAAYGPDGINFGANLGRAAGAGIPDHLHIHALPRWSGDTNFMTSIIGTRVLPEPLGVAWEKLHANWPA